MMDVPTGPRPSPGRVWALVPHPDTPPEKVFAVGVTVIDTIDDLLITYVVEGAENLRFPERLSSTRTDTLWQTTCFELFLQPEHNQRYFEFNFSPSTQWAAYEFDGHRNGMRALHLPSAPHIEPIDNGVRIEVTLPSLPPLPRRIGLSAVIEETDGTRSYWALAHAPGPPDFHNRDCFIATLPAPAAR